MIPRDSKPSCTRCRLRRVWISSPAPISSIVASASSLAARPLRRRARPPLSVPRAVSLSASFRFTLDACNAGAIPKNTPAATVSPMANKRTDWSTGTRGTGSRFGGSRRLIAAIARSDTKMPIAPPMIESARLSVSSCRNTCARAAPMAVRTAISFCRATARASNRLAMLAQAISSTKRTEHISTMSPVLSCGLTNVSKSVMR